MYIRGMLNIILPKPLISVEFVFLRARKYYAVFKISCDLEDHEICLNNWVRRLSSVTWQRPFHHWAFLDQQYSGRVVT